MFGRLVPVLAAAALLGSCGSTPDATDPQVAKGNGVEILAAVQGDEGDSATAAPSDAFAQIALEKINAARAEGQVCGGVRYDPAPSVLWHSRIAHAALLEAEWMQANNTFSHAWTDGTRVGDRLDIAEYEWHMADENIAAGFSTIDTAIAAWIDSPPHCRALMRTDLTELGVAVVPGTSANTYNYYWTMVLAKPW